MICYKIRKYTSQHNYQQQDHGENRFSLQLFPECYLSFLNFIRFPPRTYHPEKLFFGNHTVIYHTLTSESFILGSISSLTVCAIKLLKNTIKPVISTSTIRRL